MKKVNSFVSGVLVLVAAFALVSTQTASAFSLYSSDAPCLGISRDLAFGARGAAVSTLQAYLVSQQYPGGGSWMITGYYGKATVSAVRIYQSEHGLGNSGVVDSATRASLNSCGAATSYDYSRYDEGRSYRDNHNDHNWYNNGFVNTYGIPTLSALSANTGTAGNSVTIYGSGFDSINNVVTIGGVSVPNLSSNGSSITFVIPQYAAAGTTQVTVSNSRGVSNSLSFTVWSYPSVCNYGYAYNPYGYTNTNCGCSIYGTCPVQPNDLMHPTISYLTPASGAVGTVVTVYGSGFSTTGNTIHFGNGIIAGVGSNDGRGVSFTVPSTVTGYGSLATTLGAYPVSVTNSAGYTSGSQLFTVTSLGSQGAPTISSLNGPTALATGVQGIWTITIGNPSVNPSVTTSVNWGDNAVYGATAASQFYPQSNATQTFTHTYYAPGTYTATFTVTNAAGQSNTTTTTVTVTTAATSQVSLSSVSSTVTSVGSTITLYGSGLTPYDNTIHFGNGGIQQFSSYSNGTAIVYTIPSYLSMCDVMTSGYACTMVAQLVTPGTYPIYVTNTNGTSNTLYVTVR